MSEHRQQSQTHQRAKDHRREGRAERLDRETIGQEFGHDRQHGHGNQRLDRELGPKPFIRKEVERQVDEEEDRAEGIACQIGDDHRQARRLPGDQTGRGQHKNSDTAEKDPKAEALNII